MWVFAPLPHFLSKAYWLCETNIDTPLTYFYPAMILLQLLQKLSGLFYFIQNIVGIKGGLVSNKTAGMMKRFCENKFFHPQETNTEGEGFLEQNRRLLNQSKGVYFFNDFIDWKLHGY